MGITTLRCFTQLINDGLRGRLVWVSHTEIDDIFAARTRRSFQFTDDVKDIMREPRYTRKIILCHAGQVVEVSQQHGIVASSLPKVATNLS